MGNVELRSIKFPGLPDTYVISGKDIVADSADALLSDEYVTESVPYLYRQTGGGIDGAGSREVDEIVGGSVVRNQLANSRVASGWGTNGSATRSFADGICTFTANSKGSGVYAGWSNQQTGHVYFGCVQIKTATATNLIVMDWYGSSGRACEASTNWQTINSVKKATNDIASMRLRVIDTRDSGWDEVQCKDAMVVDITQELGAAVADYIYSLESTTAGAGIAKLREWGYLTDEYIPYDAGTMKSVEGLQSHDMVGFNQFNVEDYFDLATNYEYVDSAYRCRAIQLLPNTTYYLMQNAGTAVTNPIVLINNVSHVNESGFFDLRKATDAKEFTTGADGKLYIGVHQSSANISARLTECKVCINLSDPSRNGEYEPYVKHTYPLDSSLTLRGVPKLDASNNLYYDGDTYAADGTVTRRYGVVDLGTLNWSYASGAFYATLATIKHGSPIVNIVSDRYILGEAKSGLGSVSGWEDKSIRGNSSTGSYVYIKDTSYTTLADFKASLSGGAYIVYELATTTTETAEPYTNPQICDKYGTEEYVTTGVVPVGHSTKYLADLKAKIEGLPWDLSMIAPIETGTTASQAYAVGEYFLLDNQFCKAKTAIASGATFTLNTNYEVTTVADELYTALHS